MLSAPPKLALMFVATCGKLGCNMLTLHFRYLDLLEGLTCWGEFLKLQKEQNILQIQRLRIGSNLATWIPQELNMESIATARFRLA